MQGDKNEVSRTSYMIIDVEATGSNYGTDLVFEIAAIFLENDKIVNEFHKYINIPISRIYQAKQQLYYIVDINITKIKSASCYSVVFAELIEIIKKYNLGKIKMVAHNVSYDYNIIYNNARHMAPSYADTFYKYFNDHKIDTVNLSKKVFQNSARFSLDYIANYIVENENNKYLAGLLKQRKLHGALIDTKILTEIFLNIKRKNPFLVY